MSGLAPELVPAAAPHAGGHGTESARARLASRPGLSAVVADAVAVQADSAAVHALLSNHSATIREATLDLEVGVTTMPKMTDDELMARIRQLDAAGTLNQATLIDAARVGDRRRVTAMLAVASGLPLAAVDRAAAMRSVKGLISLTWKAGFTMRAAAVVQATLAQLGVGGGRLAGPDGAFPLTVDEMQWQLEVLGQAGR